MKKLSFVFLVLVSYIAGKTPLQLVKEDACYVQAGWAFGLKEKGIESVKCLPNRTWENGAPKIKAQKVREDGEVFNILICDYKLKLEGMSLTGTLKWVVDSIDGKGEGLIPFEVTVNCRGANCKQFEEKILLLTVGQLRQYFSGVKVWGRTFSIGKESAVSYLDKGFEDALDELKQTVMIKAFTEGDDSLLYMDRDLLDPQLFMVVFSLVLGSMA